MPENGLTIMLAVQLVASIASAMSWWHVARDPDPKNIRLAGYLTCAWLALFAALVAYLFDTDLIWFSLRH